MKITNEEARLRRMVNAHFWQDGARAADMPPFFLRLLKTAFYLKAEHKKVVQEAVLNDHNIIVKGAAGAGKTTLGMLWMKEQLLIDRYPKYIHSAMLKDIVAGANYLKCPPIESNPWSIRKYVFIDDVGVDTQSAGWMERFEALIDRRIVLENVTFMTLNNEAYDSMSSRVRRRMLDNGILIEIK